MTKHTPSRGKRRNEIEKMLVMYKIGQLTLYEATVLLNCLLSTKTNKGKR